MSAGQDGVGTVHSAEECGDAASTESPMESPVEPPVMASDQSAACDAGDRLGELIAKVSALSEQVHAHHTRAEARERVIDNLHAEVERLRIGEQGLLLRPVVTDLQKLHGDLLHQARTLPAEIGQQQTAELLESFALSVELALERCGSVPVRPSVGAPFSAREHRAVVLVPAERPDEDGTIGAVIADGYQDTRTDRITVPAKVQVRRWTPPAEPDGPVEAGDADSSAQRETNVDD